MGTKVESTTNTESGIEIEEDESTESNVDSELSKVFQQANDEDEESNQEEPEDEVAKTESTITEETETEDKSDDRISGIEQQLRQLNDENVRLRTENAIFREKHTTKDEDEDENEFKLDVSEINAGLAKNPGKTIADLITKIEKRTEKRILNQYKNTESTLNERDTLIAAHTRDKSEFEKNYGKFQQNDEFMNEMANIYAAIKEQNGGKYSPGSLTLAAATAHSKLTLNGKLKAPGLKLMEKKQSPIRQVLGDSKDEGDAAELDTLAEGLSASDLKIVKAVSKSTGVSMKKALKNFQKERKGNPGFGMGM